VARKPLEKWIQEALSDPDKEGDLTMLVLFHQVGQNEKEVHATKFGPSKKWKSEDLARMFQGKAETYAQDLPGYQTFVLKAYYGGRSQDEAALPFGVKGKSEFDGATEPPTAEGQRMQSMRQSEALFSQTYRRQSQQDEYAIRLLDIQNRMLVAAMQENRDAFMIMKDMMMQQALNNHQHRMEEIQAVQGMNDRKKLFQYLPILANTIMGREIFPQSTEDTALVEGLLAEMSSDQAQAIASMLKPELQGPFMGRIQKFLDKKRAEEEHEKALAKSLKSSTAAKELGIGGEEEEDKKDSE
jgi:hypothetical protein